MRSLVKIKLIGCLWTIPNPNGPNTGSFTPCNVQFMIFNNYLAVYGVFVDAKIELNEHLHVFCAG